MDETAADSPFAYDEVPYPSTAIEIASPDRLCAAGLLRGWRLPDPATASVLEIGCGAGRNLINIAAAFPQSRCVGFDLSASAIAEAQDLTERVELTNIRFEEGDILTYSREGMKFDYILCHGVYAWVPRPVQDALIALMRARLAPGGVCYLGYDCLPNASIKRAINRYLTAETKDLPPPARIERSVKLLDMLRANQHASSLVASQLNVLFESMSSLDWNYFYHDWLAEWYDPIATVDLVRKTGPAGLAFAGDARLLDLFTNDLTPAGLEAVEATTNLVSRNSLLDLLRGERTFRQDLFVRADATPELCHDGISELRFALRGGREEVQDTEGQRRVRYTAPPASFADLNTDEEIAVLDLLHAESPAEYTIGELVEQTGVDAARIEQLLRPMVYLGIVSVHATPQPFVAEPGDRPRTSKLIRVSAAMGQSIGTLRHRSMTIEDGDVRELLVLCDGTRNRNALEEALRSKFPDITRARVDEMIAAAAQDCLFEA